MAADSQRAVKAAAGLGRLRARWLAFYRRDIWQTALLRDRSTKGAVFAALRVISITLTVFAESRIATRAAALSFSSILGVGPVLALAVLVAGFALGKDDPDLVANTLHRAITAIAPQIQQYEQLSRSPTQVDPALVEVIENIIATARSGSAGALSIFSLLLIVLLLFKSIEDTFNDIWGVRQGRPLLTRIVFYWTILTLGALLFFAAIGLLGASTFLTVFMEKLPGGPWLHSLGLVLPLLSFALLTLILTVFYRVIPNTRVFWSAAFVGGLVVATLLVANNFLAFLYMKRVYLERSLYGGLALPLVAMSVFFVFWICVLAGGIVSYALQNVHFRNSQAAWSTLSEAMRERLALVVFLTVCRRFRDCLPPISASQLSALLKVPTQLLNECLNRLVHLELLAPLRPDSTATAADELYLPARPLNRITLHEFKTLDDNFGEDPIGNSLEHIDPLLRQYDLALHRAGEQPFFRKTVDELCAEFPFDDSRPPFALDEISSPPTPEPDAGAR